MKKIQPEIDEIKVKYKDNKRIPNFQRFPECPRKSLGSLSILNVLSDLRDPRRT
jgi:hypothetical protein